MPEAEWGSVRRLLVARMDNAGDVVMCGPALRAIRKTLPDCHLALWASPGGAQVAPLLPEIDDTLVTRAVWQDLGHLPFDPPRERDLVQALADRGYDGAIFFTSFAQSPFPAAYACYLAGIPLRAGQSKEFGGAVLSHAVTPLPDATHQVDRNLHLVTSLGFPDDGIRLKIRVPAEAHDLLGLSLRFKGINYGRPFVVLHPGASCPSRRYPVERFAEVGRALWQSAHLPTVITGAERDRDLAENLKAAIGPGAVSLAGETTLAEFAALVERATVVVTNNTLTMHLADAVGTPEVVLFAGTELEEQWQPRGTRARLLRRPTPCHPCYRFTCPYEGLPCLDIPPSEVVAAVLELAGSAAR
jgi:ADP-heptose:LPS heptosyltransferase